MEKSKGFITVATGKEEYYRLAQNLLHSYRYFCDTPLPFAILCDRENEFTTEFDDVLIFRGEAVNSYLDKLKLGENLPYDANIFIDADCLAYGDLNRFFDYFEGADDFSCFGRVLPLEDKTGWFEYENLGELQGKVSYVLGLHGGIYFMRKGDTSRKVFSDAQALIPDYSKFKFKGRFDTPGDEPLIALSMAINHCHPIPFKGGAICCYWERVGCMSIDIAEGKAMIKNEPKETINLVHWGTRYTRELEYQKQIELLHIVEIYGIKDSGRLRKCRVKYGILMEVERRKKFAVRVINKIKRRYKSIGKRVT